MGDDFKLNPIVSIGSTQLQLPCASPTDPGWERFAYHEVAWTGACGNADFVYDACLKVDLAQNPVAPNPVLPTHMRFGAAGGGGYRDKLAENSPQGNQICNPKPATRSYYPPV
jgi:hypothetical protein